MGGMAAGVKYLWWALFCVASSNRHTWASSEEIHDRLKLTHFTCEQNRDSPTQIDYRCEVAFDDHILSSRWRRNRLLRVLSGLDIANLLEETLSDDGVRRMERLLVDNGISLPSFADGEELRHGDTSPFRVTTQMVASPETEALSIKFPCSHVGVLRAVAPWAEHGSNAYSTKWRVQIPLDLSGSRT